MHVKLLSYQFRLVIVNCFRPTGIHNIIACKNSTEYNMKHFFQPCNFNLNLFKLWRKVLLWFYAIFMYNMIIIKILIVERLSHLTIQYQVLIITYSFFDLYFVFILLLRLTWAVKVAAALGGSFLLSPATFPLLISLTDTFFTLKPTLSPGRASARASWCISTDFTSVVRLEGQKVTTVPGFRIPVSTRPTGTVPIPERVKEAYQAFSIDINIPE